MTSVAFAIPALAAVGPLAVDVLTTIGAFLALEERWTALVEEAGLGHPFVSHEWVRTWWESFGSGRDLYIVTVSNAAGVIVAIAPLMRSEARMYGMRIRRLESMTNAHSPRFDFILGKTSGDVCAAIWTCLRRRSHEWDVLQLTQLPAGSAVALEVPALARQSGFLTGRWVADASPYLPIAGTWDQYFQALAAKHRSNLRNRFKRLKTVGPVALETVRSPEALEDGLRLEAAAWKGREGTAIACAADVRRFYHELAVRASARGALRLQFLTVGGQRIAFQYVLRSGGKQYLLKPGYDPAFAPYSPSNLLCALALEEAFRDGLTEHDFLGAAEEWKRQWAPCTRPHEWVFVFPDTMCGRALYNLKFRLLPRLREQPLYRSFRAAAVICGIRV